MNATLSVLYTLSLLVACASVACSGDPAAFTPSTDPVVGQGGVGGAGGQTSSNGGATSVGSVGGFSRTGSGGDRPVQAAELWYAVDHTLVHIALNSDGSVAALQPSAMNGDFEVGQNAITVLADGALFGSRLSKATLTTSFYYIAEPPTDGSEVTPTPLGVMPDGIMIEGLYTDCDGRLYAMDTGSNETNAAGNRLIRFVGDVLSSDFSFDVVTDLSSADVADIDDMGPGIVDNEISDNPGLAIDSGKIHAFDYETGTGTLVGEGGSYGIHALGGALFGDGTSRLYVLSVDAELYEMNPDTFALSDVLTTGPTPPNGHAGWSGLAGPLTDCDSGFVIK